MTSRFHRCKKCNQKPGPTTTPVPTKPKRPVATQPKGAGSSGFNNATLSDIDPIMQISGVVQPGNTWTKMKGPQYLS